MPLTMKKCFVGVDNLGVEMLLGVEMPLIVLPLGVEVAGRRSGWASKVAGRRNLGVEWASNATGSRSY